MSKHKSMQHWNGDQCCAIDCETTGLDGNWHEIIQLAIVPLTADLEPRKDVIPFTVYMQCEHLERCDEHARKMNRKKLVKAAEHGFDKETAKDLLRDWVGKLGLPFTNSGRRKRIIPLGQNYGFDRGFIQSWLGRQEYDEYFHYHYKDTMCVSAFLNDRAAWHAEKIPFPKTNLSYLANLLNVPHHDAHDALSDAVVAAQVYKKMLQFGGLLG